MHVVRLFLIIDRPGENVRLAVKGVDETNVGSGHVLCDKDLVPVVSEFEAMLVIQELSKEKSLLTAGYEAVLHMHTGTSTFM